MKEKKYKNGSLAPVQKPSLPAQPDDQSLKVQAVIDATDKQIKEGLEKTTASTGFPMDDLSGGAKLMAQLSNIGGGSVETGGGGAKSGLNTIMANMLAKGAVSAETHQKESPLKKIEDVSQK